MTGPSEAFWAIQNTTLRAVEPDDSICLLLYVRTNLFNSVIGLKRRDLNGLRIYYRLTVISGS